MGNDVCLVGTGLENCRHRLINAGTALREDTVRWLGNASPAVCSQPFAYMLSVIDSESADLEAVMGLARI